MSDLPTTDPFQTAHPSDGRAPRQQLALVVAWCTEAPSRAGEVILIPPNIPAILGRSDADSDAGEALTPVRQRPGHNRPCPPLAGRALSRQQLALHATADSLTVRNIGRCPLQLRGHTVSEGIAKVGDVLVLKGTLVLQVVRLPSQLPDTHAYPRAMWPEFGQPDGTGFVGEPPAAWEVRERAAFIAARSAHVLIHGESGTGKELVARAVHTLSSRSESPLVSRNAATLPDGLVAAELFGNARNYPNPGMDARPGMVGEASGSSLLLDEIGEVSEALQAQLLRVMDSGGEYTRLGEARSRHSDLRLIAVTNRSPQVLKHDLLARLPLRLRLPTLAERRSDIPLLLRHRLCTLARSDAGLASILDEHGEPRVSTRLIAALLGHSYPLNVRELEALMWTALTTSPADHLQLTDAVKAALHAQKPATTATTVRPADISAEHIQAVLDRNGGVLETTWRELGLKNRFQLIRLVKRHQLVTRKHSRE